MVRTCVAHDLPGSHQTFAHLPGQVSFSSPGSRTNAAAPPELVADGSLTPGRYQRTIRPYSLVRTQLSPLTLSVAAADAHMSWSGLKGATVEAEPRDYQEVIDQALQLVYSHHHRLVGQLAPETFRPLSLDQLRTGPFGEDLLRLARLARGQSREPKEQVIEAIESVWRWLT